MPRALLAATLGALAVLAGPASATDFETGFVPRVFVNADGSKSPYVLFVPHDYDGSKAYPVILFLHGSGESKGGAKQPVEQGIGTAIKAREKTFPALVVIPQSENRTWRADSDDAKRALAMLDEVVMGYKADPDRVYLTGLSMGGAGTWSVAAAHPTRWAAIAPICAGGDVKDADKLKGLPCWSFVGDADKEPTVAGMKAMAEALTKAGAAAKHTVYPGVGHNSWDAAYGEKLFFPWLLAQKRK